MTNETIRRALLDIADYFRRCWHNAETGSAAERRFERYIDAVTEAAARLREAADAKTHTGTDSHPDA